MRTLDVNELEAVAGGRSLRREDSLSDWLDALIGSLTVSVHGSLDRTSGGGGSDVDWNADPSSWFGGGGGSGGGDGGGIIGYPVDLDPSSIKDATDYEKEWKAVFDKMSPAELKAFDAQLERDYARVGQFDFELKDYLLEFKNANGDPGKMGMASSRAAQNASPITLGLIEAALTRAYAVAAALPGGI